jgi:hypothetical protein
MQSYWTTDPSRGQRSLLVHQPIQGAISQAPKPRIDPGPRSADRTGSRRVVTDWGERPLPRPASFTAETAETPESRRKVLPDRTYVRVRSDPSESKTLISVLLCHLRDLCGESSG